jgi:hypothetical protein
MGFDAGAVEAKLTLDPSAFDRTLAKARADGDKFEREGLKVRIAAEFDSEDMTRARRMFTDLDNAISKDAMNRLRSSPQGSVLGSLNALFSPHPVSGAPSPSQSAQQGLLGKMLSPESGGGLASGSGAGSPLASVLTQNGTGTGNITQSLTGQGAGNASAEEMIRQALTGAGPGNVSTEDMIRQQLTGQGPGNANTEDLIRQVLTGQGPGNVSTEDMIRQQLTGNAPGNVKTSDLISQVVTGAAPGNIKTTDTITEKLSPSAAEIVKESGVTGDASGASFSQQFRNHLLGGLLGNMLGGLGPGGGGGVAKDAEQSGDDAGAGWTSGFMSHLGLLFEKRLSDEGDSDGKALGKGLVGGIGPGILGLGLKISSVVGLIGAGLGTLPALLGIIGTGMGVAMTGGLLAEAVKGNAKLKAQFAGLGGDFTSVITKAASPVIPALSKIIGQIPPLIKSLQGPLTGIFKTIGPQLQGVFGGLAPIMTGLLAIMKNAAPAFGPFIGAIEKLVGNLLPGIATAAKAAVPFIGALAGIFGTLGGNLGGFFGAAGPAIKSSMSLLKDLLGVVGALLPAVTKIADVFAAALGPVFSGFAGVIKGLVPTFQLIGGVVAMFAKAVIGDLAGALAAVVTLVQGAQPGLTALADAFGVLFGVLENSGLFAELGDALENVAPLLGKLIGLILTDLAPVLPQVVGAFGNLLVIIISLTTGALSGLIKGLTDVISAVPPDVIRAVAASFIVLKLAMMGFEGFSAVFRAIGGAIAFMTAALDFDTIALKAMYAWDAIVSAATDAAAAATGIWTAATGALDAVLASSTVGAIASAAAQAAAWVASSAVIVASFAAQAAAAAVAFVAENAATLGIIAGIALLVAGIVYLATHWKQVWGDVKSAAEDAWGFISGGWGKYLLPMLGPAGILALAALELYQHWHTIWANVKDDASDLWQWLWADFGQKIYSFFTGTLPGWFATAVTAIGDVWSGIENTVKIPVNWVLQNVVDPLFGAIDDVTGFVGLGRPLPTNLSLSGGGKLPGYGGGDVVPALLEPGEAVVDKDKTRQFAWLFKLMGVPGFAAGGLPGGGVLGDVGGAVGGILGGGGDVLKILADLASGNTGAAGRAFASLTGSGAGGAAGGFAKALLDLPGKLIGDAVKYLLGAGGATGSQGGANGRYGVLSGTAGQVQALMQQMAAARGWVAGLWNDLNAVEMAEAGYNLNAVNPTSGAYGIAQFINGASEYAQYGGNATTMAGQITAMLNYIACVPLDVSILTRYGWKSYAEVRPGDETVGFDPQTGESRWTAITAVHHYDSAPIRRMRNGRVDLRATPNHRWAAEKFIQPETRPNYYRQEMVRTDQIGTRHRIRLAARLAQTECLPITPIEAELLGWVAGDGHAYRRDMHGKGGSCAEVGVFQSEAKPALLTALRALVKDLPHSEYVRPPIGGRAPIHQFRLRSPYAHDLMGRSGYEGSLELMVVRMSTEQRQAFLDGLLKADGHRHHGDNGWTLCQNEGPILDAAVLAASLLGNFCHLTNSGGQKHVVVTAGPYVKGNLDARHQEECLPGPVWCVTTELGTWTARQSGQVFLTGNSRYGNPAGAWLHEESQHWYGQGGLISEPVIGYGTNSGQVYVLGEQGPEWVTPAGGGAGLGPQGQGGGGLADSINLMLPEGTTVAAALTELTWYLQASRMQAAP